MNHENFGGVFLSAFIAWSKTVSTLVNNANGYQSTVGGLTTSVCARKGWPAVQSMKHKDRSKLVNQPKSAGFFVFLLVKRTCRIFFQASEANLRMLLVPHMIAVK